MIDRQDDPENPFGIHRPDGTYAHGPQTIRCALAVLIYFTFCEITASTPDGARRERVVGKSRDALRAAQHWRDHPLGPDWRDPRADYYCAVLRLAGEPVKDERFAYVGRFSGPRKPKNAGRKKRAAA